MGQSGSKGQSSSKGRGDSLPSDTEETQKRKSGKSGKWHGKRSMAITEADETRRRLSGQESYDEGIHRVTEAMRRQRDKQKKASTGWQGTSQETFEDLLREVTKLDIGSYPNVKALEDAIYKIYAKNDNLTSTEDLSHSTPDNITPPDGVEISPHKGYIYFKNKNINKEEMTDKILMRISLNTRLDRTFDVMKDIIEEQHIANLPYVRNVKMVEKYSSAAKRYDPIVIFYYDTLEGTNTSILGQRLLDLYAKDVRPNHLAIMQPINKKNESRYCICRYK